MNVWNKLLLKMLRRPVFFLVKKPWIERNEPLVVVDMTQDQDLEWCLKRPGNEKAQYILVGFEVQK